MNCVNCGGRIASDDSCTCTGSRVVEFEDHVEEVSFLKQENERYRQVLGIITADTEYPCEIMDLEGGDGPCQCTCCRWARLAREALLVV